MNPTLADTIATGILTLTLLPALTAATAVHIQQWRKRQQAHAQQGRQPIAAPPAAPAPEPVEVEHQGATEDWHPAEEVADLPIDYNLMTPEEKIAAIRAHTPLPVDLDGEAFRRDLEARFDALIDGIAEQLPTDERAKFDRWRLRLRTGTTAEPDDTGRIDRALLDAALALPPMTPAELDALLADHAVAGAR